MLGFSLSQVRALAAVDYLDGRPYFSEDGRATFYASPQMLAEMSGRSDISLKWQTLSVSRFGYVTIVTPGPNPEVLTFTREQMRERLRRIIA
jgi:hypothetical protein